MKSAIAEPSRRNSGLYASPISSPQRLPDSSSSSGLEPAEGRPGQQRAPDDHGVRLPRPFAERAADRRGRRSSTWLVSRLPLGRLGRSDADQRELRGLRPPARGRRSPRAARPRPPRGSAPRGPARRSGCGPSLIWAFLVLVDVDADDVEPNRREQAPRRPCRRTPVRRWRSRIVSVIGCSGRHRSPAARRSRRRGSGRGRARGCQPIASRIFSIAGLAVERVLDALAVDLVVRDEHDLGARARSRRVTRSASSRIAHPLGGADVEDLARELARVHQALRARGSCPRRGRTSASACRRRAPRAARRRARCSTKRGITIPYWPLCRGPTVLKSRTITQSRLALAGGTRARGARPSPSSRRRASASAVVGP